MTAKRGSAPARLPFSHLVEFSPRAAAF